MIPFVNSGRTDAGEAGVDGCRPSLPTDLKEYRTESGPLNEPAREERKA